MATTTQAVPNKSIYKEFVYGGLAGMAAAVATHPADLVKVRMQLDGEMSKSTTTARQGVLQTGINVFKSDGVLGLYKGLSASLLRQCTYTTTRFGLYNYLKDKLTDRYQGSKPPFYGMFLCSMLGGMGGAIIGTPADVVLVRMQADGRLPMAMRRNYRNALDGVYQVAKNEGIATMWKGCTPNVYRAMLMSAGQLASYDQAKYMLLMTPWFKENTTTHFCSSLIAGFIASVITSPFDVVKTRIMNMQTSADGQVMYKNMADCFFKILKNEGPLALYKGFIPYFVRLGPTTIITFLAYENIKKLSNYLSGQL